jgi:DNA-binding transcriptional LysR family regulator
MPISSEIELRHFRCFVALADDLHFSRAARHLGLTQPNLSQQIRALEHSLGVRLLDRTTTHVALTAAGQAFLPDAKELVALADAPLE